MSSAIVSGATGGIGLPLTRYLLSHTPLRVLALTSSTRSAKDIKSDLLSSSVSSSGEHGKTAQDRLIVVEGTDLTDEKTIERAAKRAEEEGLKGDVRLAVCFAGVLLPEKSISQINPEDSLKSYRLNTLSHLLFYKHFVPFIPTLTGLKKASASWSSPSDDPAHELLRSGTSVCLSLSARVGSIGDNQKGGWYSYRVTKAALNQVIHTLDLELAMRKSSAVAMAYHPGTVLTPFTKPVIGDKGGKSDPSHGLFTPDEAREKLVGLLGKANREEGYGGGFYDWKGEKVPW